VDKKFIWIAGGGLLLVIILVIVLVTSSGKKPVTDTSTSSVSTFTIWDYNNEKTAYDQLIQDFQGDWKVQVNYVSKNPNTYLTDTINAIAAGNGPDVWIVPAKYMVSIKDKLLPMPDDGTQASRASNVQTIANNYPLAVVTDNVFNSQIYGVPLAIDNLKLFINGAIISQKLEELKKANPSADINALSQTYASPKTWDEVVSTSKFLTTKTNGKITQAGLAFGTANNIDNADQLLTLIMMQNGAKMTSDDLTSAQFHTIQNQYSNIQYPGTKALEFYAGFADSKNANYSWDTSFPEATQAFAQGKVAMMIGDNKTAAEIKSLAPNFNFITTAIPQIANTAHPVNLADYDTLTVPKSTQNQALSWTFILKATDSQYANNYTRLTGKTTAANPDGQTQSWYNPDPATVTTILKTAISQVNDGKSAQTALDGAASQITTLLYKLIQTQSTK